jgi:hypothetical protein
VLTYRRESTIETLAPSNRRADLKVLVQGQADGDLLGVGSCAAAERVRPVFSGESRETTALGAPRILCAFQRRTSGGGSARSPLSKPLLREAGSSRSCVGERKPATQSPCKRTQDALPKGAPLRSGKPLCETKWVQVLSRVRPNPSQRACAPCPWLGSEGSRAASQASAETLHPWSRNDRREPVRLSVRSAFLQGMHAATRARVSGEEAR